jgi:hypothetical protein
MAFAAVMVLGVAIGSQLLMPRSPAYVVLMFHNIVSLLALLAFVALVNGIKRK